MFFNLDSREQATVLDSLRSVARQPFVAPETERAAFHLCPGEEEEVRDDIIQIQELSIPHLQVAASILAKSVVLGHYEKSMAEATNRIEPLAAGLRKGIAFGGRSKTLLRHLGEVGAAERAQRAVEEVIAEGKSVTYDLKPTRDDPTAVGTAEMADAIIEKMEV